MKVMLCANIIIYIYIYIYTRENVVLDLILKYPAIKCDSFSQKGPSVDLIPFEILLQKEST